MRKIIDAFFHFAEKSPILTSFTKAILFHYCGRIDILRRGSFDHVQRPYFHQMRLGFSSHQRDFRCLYDFGHSAKAKVLRYRMVVSVSVSFRIPVLTSTGSLGCQGHQEPMQSFNECLALDWARIPFGLDRMMQNGGITHPYTGRASVVSCK